MNVSLSSLRSRYPRKSCDGRQLLVQHIFILGCNWIAPQTFQESGMIPNFQIAQVIEYVHGALYLRATPQTDGDEHPALVVDPDRPAEIFCAGEKFLIAPIA